MNALDHMEVWRVAQQAMSEEARKCDLDASDTERTYRALSYFAGAVADGYEKIGVRELDRELARDEAPGYPPMIAP